MPSEMIFTYPCTFSELKQIYKKLSPLFGLHNSESTFQFNMKRLIRYRTREDLKMLLLFDKKNDMTTNLPKEIRDRIKTLCETPPPPIVTNDRRDCVRRSIVKALYDAKIAQQQYEKLIRLGQRQQLRRKVK